MIASLGFVAPSVTVLSPDTEAYRRVFKDLFKSPCPKLTEHRWMYLHEVLSWVWPRQHAMQYMQLDSFGDGRQDGDEDSVPFDEVYSLDLIAEVCDASSIKGAEFWLMCGLCRSLAAWGHRFSGMLHGCPCHTHEEKMEAKSKGKQRKRSAATASEDVLCLPGSFLPVATDGVAVPEKCPMEGRMAVALAGGLHEEAVAGLQESARKLSRHTQLALERLQGLDASRASAVLDCFQTAVGRMAFRTNQSFSYWLQLPWALLALAKPFVARFDSPDEASRISVVPEDSQTPKPLARWRAEAFFSLYNVLFMFWWRQADAYANAVALPRFSWRATTLQRTRLRWEHLCCIVTPVQQDLIKPFCLSV